MKKIFFITLLIAGIIPLKAQENKVDQLQSLEQNQTAGQNVTATATLKASSRLFAAKDDLTSVILIIPADSVVDVLDSDSTYYHVTYQGNEGYITKNHAELNKVESNIQQNIVQQPLVQQTPPEQNQQQDRYSYLENKYGIKMADKLMAGKIWKGMNAEMVHDSWGTAEKINRTISGNITKEEWIFRNTWLYFENNILTEWGPVKK
jgi:hypothetical protein